MKFSSTLSAVAALAGVATAASAQDCVTLALKAIPSCAQTCFLNGAPSIGCAGTDFACQCQSQPRLMAAVEGCVQKSCASSEFQGVIDGGAQVCACAASLAPSAAQGSMTVRPSNTVVPTGTTAPAPTVSAGADKPGVMAGVVGGALLAALAL